LQGVLNSPTSKFELASNDLFVREQMLEVRAKSPLHFAVAVCDPKIMLQSTLIVMEFSCQKRKQQVFFIGNDGEKISFHCYAALTS
jgi:hypothetical protein